MKSSKRMFSVILAALMTASVVPVNSLADDISVKDTEVAASVEAEQSVFVMMNVPYKALYKSTGIQSEQVDAVTTATTSKFKMTTGLATGTYNDGTNISGVVIPVKMTASQYQQLGPKFSALSEDADYHLTAYSGTPSAYLELTGTEPSELSFKYVGENKDASSISISDISTNTSYGNYQFDVNGVEFDAQSDGKYIVVNGERSIVLGSYLTDSNGENYAMYMLDNIWLGRTFEIAWSVKDAKPIHKAHNNPDAPLFHQYNMNGKKLASVTFITTNGIYTVPANKTLPKLYDATNISVNNAKVSSGSAVISGLKAVPRSLNVQYTVTNASGEDVTSAYSFKVSGTNLKYSKKTPNGKYTLTISDKNNVYDSVSASFNLTADTVPAAFNASSMAIKGKNISSYLSAISGYAVDGVKTSVPIVDKQTGAVDLNASINFRGQTSYAFTKSGTHTVTIFADGYPEFNFNISVKVAEDGTVTSAPAIKAPSVKLTAGNKKVTVKLGTVKGASYEIICSNGKTYTSQSASKTIASLKKGKKYTFSARAIVKSSDAVYYSDWSAAKSVKVK